MRFTKMHGLGNDFLVIDARQLDGGTDFAALARRLCDRHTGVGADGLLLVLPSETADVRMRIINSDGSEPEMCGNGIRCFARYAFEQGVVQKSAFTVETLAGPRAAGAAAHRRAGARGARGHGRAADGPGGHPRRGRGDLPGTCRSRRGARR